MNPRASVTAVVAAAGSGERLGAGGPKAFVSLAGRPLVEWSIAALRETEGVGSIVVACPPGGDSGPVGDLPAALRDDADLVLVEGGETRSRSVANALEAVRTELVAVHDAARPLLTPALAEAVIAALLADPDADGAIAAAPVTDTIKRAATGDAATAASPATLVESSISEMSDSTLVVEQTVDRGHLWAAQTPQVFRVEALRRALGADPGRVEAATDEAILVEQAGGRVLLQPSPPENLKVTTPLDLRVAELLLLDR